MTKKYSDDPRVSLNVLCFVLIMLSETEQVYNRFIEKSLYIFSDQYFLLSFVLLQIEISYYFERNIKRMF